jgi:monoamine oxidase
MVHCCSGDGSALQPLRARTAIVTLPAAVLKSGEVKFDPQIAEKQRALAGLEIGQIFKVVLRFREAFWDEADFLKARRRNGRGGSGAADGINFLHAQGAEIPTWWTTAPIRASLITGWVGGSTADALLSADPATRLERSLISLSQTLTTPRRELEEQLDAWASHDWRSDAFARGAYSYIGVGGYAAPVTLARPVEGTLFFAGEATNRDHIGTVAGALASGRRAAREVQRTLQ